MALHGPETRDPLPFPSVCAWDRLLQVFAVCIRSGLGHRHENSSDQGFTSQPDGKLARQSDTTFDA